jgi:FtsP/CotA-like multicopper oxidase with cupredoxin domain
MREIKMNTAISKVTKFFGIAVLASLVATTAFAAVPGITGPTFNLTAQEGRLNQPDGAAVYSWGYGCNGAPAGFLPAAIAGAKCSTMQVPGPTLIVTEGQTVTVNLTNNLPNAAGNTSILFPGFQVKVGATFDNSGKCLTNCGVTGVLTQEAAPGATVTYTFTASSPGTRAYYSGTQGDLQVEMGLYGAIIVLPNAVPANCTSGLAAANRSVEVAWGEADYRLAAAAYDHPKTCYDREYLFQWAEMDSRIHKQAEAQVLAAAGCAAGAPGCSLNVQVEPYHPAYFLINGRSMPDLMDPNYAAEYPHQPYNGNPHMHPGEQVLIRTIGQGRWQHPFHEHGNHVRILARDGNLILTPDGQALAGILMFNTDTTPGEAFDGIFYWSGRGLNWDPFGHHPPASGAANPTATNENLFPTDRLASLPCYPDSNGYWTANSPNFFNTAINPDGYKAVNYYEWCQDHDKPVEANPFGDVAGGGPATLPNPQIFTNGPWYGGSPYLGPDASVRGNAPACDTKGAAGCTNLLPSNLQANPASERGWAFMWHSHNEREITTNNVFPGGMLMMMLVDSREFLIDESL